MQSSHENMYCLLITLLKPNYFKKQCSSSSFLLTYAQVPIKRVGPNKREGWVSNVNVIKQVGPNKGLGWRKRLKIQKIAPNKREGWKSC